jgi:MarR family transcriptional regulator, transcriptional regulator for hemolysin
MKFERGRSLGYMTNWAARLFARAIDRRLKPLGLSSGQMPVFFALGDGAALTQKELAARAAIEQPTMAATLARMERDGLIERRADPKDGRRALISLTSAGMDKMVAVREAIADVNAAAAAGLDGKQDEVLAALRAMVEALEAEKK